MQEIIDAIEEKLLTSRRVILAIAAPPAAGKSTLAAELAAYFSHSVIVPMDGFHLDNSVLDAEGLRARKGSAESFDADGFVSLMRRIAKSEPVYAPQFDRALDLSRAGAIRVNDEKLIIVEGNYLLLNKAPWTSLHGLWDLSVWINVSADEVEKRCVERWLSYGFDSEMAQKKARENDRVNAEFVIENSLPAQIVWTQ